MNDPVRGDLLVIDGTDHHMFRGWFNKVNQYQIILFCQGEYRQLGSKAHLS